MTNTRKKTAISTKPALSGKKTLNSDELAPLADELLQLDDDFTEYSEISSFLCLAFATALSNHESLNKDVISGAMRCSNWLQFRSGELKDDIKHAHARYVVEHK
jgi:hypothetical protein